MAVFDGLLLYEWVLLVLGIILFFVLVIAFFYQLKRNGSIGALLGFFLLPIAMIGYPSIQSIQYKDGLVSIDKTTRDLQSAPTDPKLRSQLEQEVAKSSARPTTDATSLTLLAKAEYALGHEQAATAKLQQALQSSPKLPQALELQDKITTFDKLEKVSATVESNPNDAAAKAELSQTLNKATLLPLANPTAIARIARAQTALGDHQRALSTANTALAIDPKLEPAIQLKKQILVHTMTVAHP